ncbi:MFS transporter [Variovorax sp. YR216]|uniref:MFS transporter n=1 Tax=Variovorax sp. YR216 TaxID=1882828 RepID=UPI00089C4C77|nr:MFS transporter [Variovorax sp. YR216]SEB15995.1 Predicted arabinose efflux permease, MFS family [Variovorax sp. YR216]
MVLSERWSARAALMVAHCAGMVDLVALPIWIGTLMAHYRFDPQQAGSLATCFLVSAVVASAFTARRFDRIRARFVAASAFGLAALAFAACSQMRGFGGLAVLHGIGGFAAGTALSITHGTVGLSANPHRLFGIMGTGLGVFAVLFLAATPQVIASVGGSALFVVIGVVMGIACIVTACFFPDGQPESATMHARRGPLSRQVWFPILGICCMALTQAMVFAFLERMGAQRGFDPASVNLLLIALGLINLAPGLLAAMLQRRLDARKVLLAGATLQCLLALVLAWSSTFVPYAGAGAVFVAVMIFTHTFCFGLLARLDPSGRAVAATPAMLMVGSAIGPLLGGTLVKGFGYGALGVAALAIDLAALALFVRVGRTPDGFTPEVLNAGVDI